ncbi:mechanosensitive ion channel family protein [Nocardioides caldifontis]|uniref:mechanosensitive ion channel family protein n=1 Tax=Nocardioides caldifontis TaxID=2588938 RepID=UPI0011DF4B7F|nr:mechanosensitive ion channel family protein [Nocardioides caldifontis]
MIPLTETTPECEQEDWLCKQVTDLTGNEWLGAAADWLIAKPAIILFVVLLGLLCRWLAYKLVNRLVERASTGVLPTSPQGRFHTDVAPDNAAARIAAARRKQRAETMGAVLKSVASFTILVIVVIMSLSELSVNVGPLIAGAGIVGVALGFGAQSLVSDFLSGLFMLFEDQYGIGDVVDLGDASGTVEAVTLRITRLRDVNGTVWYIRNGEIRRVGNQSQNWARTVLDVTVGYGEDLPRIRQVLAETCQALYDDPEWRGKVMEEPEVWGVERMEADGIAVRVAIKTAPLEQWAVARELRERIKQRFDREGIEIPFPQRVVWQRSEPPTPMAGSDADDA